MSAAIDERTAWELVRTVRAEHSGSGRCRVEGEGGAWLEVEADGGWRTDLPVDDPARQLFDIYLPIVARSEVVVGQLGQSLDGRIATESGASHYVTGPEDIERLHRLRALVDAVVVGAETVLLDDPRLTVRLVEGDDPVRVLIDPNGRVGPDSRVRSDGAARTVSVVRAPDHVEAAGLSGDRLEVPASGTGELELAALLDALRQEGLGRILVEGGGVTVSRFFQAGLLDRLHLTVAPLLIGSGRPSLTLDVIASLDEAIRPDCRRFTLGEDVLFDLDLRAPPPTGRSASEPGHGAAS